MNRDAALERLFSAEEVFDIAVIGGGATGLGVAVDAATRGYRVALLDQADFAKGTSSRSTKLVHGGVRYLRQGNVSLVLDALRERDRLARNAPHLVARLPFVIPSYRWWERAYYGVGLRLYDALAGRRAGPGSRLLDAAETVTRLPTIARDGLHGGVLYHDHQFDDARLAVNLARTAAEAGALVLNYCACTGFVRERDRIAGLRVRDEESGRERALRARVVVNATGVFVDQLRRLDDAGSRPLLRVSQGVHLVLPKRFLPGEAALMIPRTADGRVLFAVPWQGRVVLGTTDTPRPEAALEPRALPAERQFLLAHARRYLADAPEEADILSVFAGLRPLVARGDARRTAALSRDHTIECSASGLLTVTGGKWTTYRRMAEDVVNQAERIAGWPHRPAVTAALAIHGATADAGPMPELTRYGTDAGGIVALTEAQPELREPIHGALPYWRAEVVWHARHEMARTVEDVLARRTRALLLDARASIAAAPVVARLLATELGRDEAWVAQQLRSYEALARGYVFADPSSRA